MNEQSHESDPKAATVRPRWVWAGTSLAVAGIVCAGIGLMLLTDGVVGRWVTAAGVVTLIIGVLAARHGRILQDAVSDPSGELEAVVEGDQHQGVSTQGRVRDEVAQQRAVEITHRKDDLLAASQAAATPNPALAGAFALIAVGAWLGLVQWFVAIGWDTTTQAAAARDGICGIIAILVGLRLRLPSKAVWASVLGLAAGVLLVASAFLSDGHSGVQRADDLIAGAIILAAGAATLT